MSQPSSITRILRRPAATAESVESVALLLGAAAFVVGAVIAALVHWGENLPIAGPGSLGQFVAIGSAVTAIVAFVAGRFVTRAPNPKLQQQVSHTLEIPGAGLHWFDIAALALAHSAIALLGWIGIADLLEQSFIGAVVFPLPAAVLAGVGLAVTAYAVFLSSVRLTPMLLSLVLAVFLVVGALAAMLSSSDPDWWKENLSALGITNDISSFAFNLTLIIAGAIVTIIARYATASLPAATPTEVKRRNLVRIGLIVIGVFLACVGIFPVSEFFLLHNTVATGMAVAFAGIVIGMPWLLPSMPRVFVILGYVYVGVIVVLGIFFAVDYYNLTAVELVAGVLIFSWIIVFLRNAGAVHDQTREVAETDLGRVPTPVG